MTIRGAKLSHLALAAALVLTLTGCMVDGSVGETTSEASTTESTPSSSAPSATTTTSTSPPDNADGLSIDDGVFAYSEEYHVSNETLVVTGTPARDQAKIIAALVKAGNRFMLVDETGVEHPDEAGAEAARMADLYTPNYVADPEVTADGVKLYVDCKSSIEDPMAQTFRKILREELTGAGIRGRVRAVSY